MQKIEKVGEVNEWISERAMIEWRIRGRRPDFTKPNCLKQLRKEGKGCREMAASRKLYSTIFDWERKKRVELIVDPLLVIVPQRRGLEFCEKSLHGEEEEFDVYDETQNIVLMRWVVNLRSIWRDDVRSWEKINPMLYEPKKSGKERENRARLSI